MASFEDYYEILQVSPSAEPEVIEAAYRKLAQKYHPDVNKSPTAAEKMKKINVAHDVLGDPVQRKRYHAEWLQRKRGKTSYTGTPAPAKPKPVVKPSRIRFGNMRPGQTKKTTFVIENAGGPYTKLWFSNPQSWLRVISWRSLTTSEELPLEVEIEATGLDWGETSTEHIVVRLDDEEARVTVELQVKPKQQGPKSKPRPKQRGATSKPPPTTKQPSKQRLKIAAYVISGLIVLAIVPIILMNTLFSPQYKIAFMSGDFLRPSIHVIDADGSNERMLTYGPSLVYNPPVWSPKGTKIAWVYWTSETWPCKHGIKVVDEDGRNQKTVFVWDAADY